MTPSLAPLVRAPRKSTRKRPQLPQRSSPQPSLRTVHPSAQGRPRARCADLGCCQLGGTPRQTARLENAVHVCSDMCSITIVATKAGHAQSVMVKRQWSLAGMSRCSSVLSAFGSIASAPTWPKLARLQIPAQDTTPALKGGRSNSAPCRLHLHHFDCAGSRSSRSGATRTSRTSVRAGSWLWLPSAICRTAASASSCLSTLRR